VTAATKDTDLSSGPAGSSPFDPVQRSPRARALRVGAAVVVLGALAAGAWLLTRNDEASDVPAGHDHGVAAPAADSAQPVMLSAADARRIGEAGRRRALADHTYAQRAERMDAILRAPVESVA